ncbi:MAG: hypothetical protein LIQ26_01225, partial [Bacteroidota bacterium]|nr:hypothetical protein [Bacteroidota bacterium]
EDYILYMLVDGRVKSFDADASGVLSIALTIARSSLLAEGRSPYTLLMEVYETFRSRYMIPVSDGRDSFQNVDIDSEVFREIVRRYPTEERRSPYVVMASEGLSGFVCVPPEQMEAFFRDTQYPAFRGFKDIEVGSACLRLVPATLAELQIPRPRIYPVKVNGRLAEGTLSAVSGSFHASVPDQGLESYEPVTFSLDELLAAPDGVLVKDGATLTLDPVTETVDCRLKKKDVLYTPTLAINTNDERDLREVKEALQKGSLRLLVDGRDLTDVINNGTPILVKDVLAKTTSVHGAPDRLILQLLMSPQHQERTLRFSISVRRKAVAATPAVDWQAEPVRRRRRRRAWAPILFGTLLVAAVGVFLYIFIFGKEPQDNDLYVADQEQIDSLKQQKTGEELGTEGESTTDAGDTTELTAEEQEKLTQEEEAAKKAEEEAKAKEAEEAAAKAKAEAEAKAKAEAEAKLRAESRKACLAFLTSTIGNEDSLKGAYQAVQQMQEYKALPEEDKKTVKTVFDFAQYKDVKGNNLSGDVKEMVKEAGLDNWGNLDLLSKRIKKYIAENTQ